MTTPPPPTPQWGHSTAWSGEDGSGLNTTEPNMLLENQTPNRIAETNRFQHFCSSSEGTSKPSALWRGGGRGGECSSVYILVLKFIPAAHLMSMLLMLGGQTPSGQKWKHVCSDAADPAQQRAFNPVNIREAWIKTSRQCFLYRFEFRPTLWWKLKYRHHTAGWPVQTLRVLGRS